MVQAIGWKASRTLKTDESKEREEKNMSRTMRESIEFLKKDRSASSETFQKKLEDVGLPVYYGEFAYWNHEPYVEIGSRKVFLVESYCTMGSLCLRYRMQNDVIQEIMDTIVEEVRKTEEADQNVKNFFEKLMR